MVGQFRKVARAVAREWSRHGSQLASLVPDRNDSWQALLEDIFFSVEASAWLSTSLDDCIAHDGYASMSIDGTVKICSPLVGQATYRQSKQIRNEQPIPDGEALHTVLTIRG